MFASRNATDLEREEWTKTVVCKNDASAGSAAAASRAAARIASQTCSADFWCGGGFQAPEEPSGLRGGEAQAALAGGAVAVVFVLVSGKKRKREKKGGESVTRSDE